MLFFFLLALLFLMMCTNGAPVVDTRPSTQILRIVSHHKSGTVFTMNIWSTVCCKEKIPGDELEFWRKARDCGANCSAIFEFNGWLPRHKCGRYQKCAFSYVHVIRHPVDMLISGYLFHRKCKEPWTNSTTGNKEPLRFPQPFPVKGSYCQWLQRTNVTAGLQMELKRTLEANDGMGKMIRDMQALKPAANVFQLCLNDVANRIRMQTYIQPWNKFNRTVVYLDHPEHHTNIEEKKKLYHEAAKVLLTRMPATAVATFPCTSEYFDETGPEYAKFLTTL